MGGCPSILMHSEQHQLGIWGPGCRIPVEAAGKTRRPCLSRQGRGSGAAAASGGGSAVLPSPGRAGGALPGRPAPQRLPEENLRQQLGRREEEVGVRPDQAAGGECRSLRLRSGQVVAQGKVTPRWDLTLDTGSPRSDLLPVPFVATEDAVLACHSGRAPQAKGSGTDHTQITHRLHSTSLL